MKQSAKDARLLRQWNKCRDSFRKHFSGYSHKGFGRKPDKIQFGWYKKEWLLP